MEQQHSIYNAEYAQKYLSTAEYKYTRLKVTRAAQLITRDGRQDQVVLDIGGNINSVIKKGQRGALEALDASCKYFALDISSAYFCVEPLRRINSNIEYYEDTRGITADAHKLPINSGSVDSVILADVLEHLDNPPEVLSEIFRALKPGGELLLTLPAIYKLDILKNRRPDLAQAVDARRNTSHVNFFDIPSVECLLENANLKPIIIEGLDYGVGFPYLTWVDPLYIPSKQDSYPNPRSGAFKEIKKLLDSIPLEDHLMLDRVMNNKGAIELVDQQLSGNNRHPLHIMHDYLPLHPNYESKPNLKQIKKQIEEKVNRIEDDFDPKKIKDMLSLARSSGAPSLAGSFTIVAKKV